MEDEKKYIKEFSIDNFNNQIGHISFNFNKNYDKVWYNEWPLYKRRCFLTEIPSINIEDWISKIQARSRMQCWEELIILEAERRGLKAWIEI